MTNAVMASDNKHIDSFRAQARQLPVRGIGVPAREVVAAVESTCPCGQALEWCQTGHCPRCGISLRG